MIKTITIFFFFLLSITLTAQSSELLNGKWVFKKALNKEVDDLGRKTLKSDIINKMTFEFKSNSEFSAFAFGQNMNGKWALSKNAKVITLSTGEEKFELLILKLTESELILKFGLGEFLMKKL
ncbi:hypothetical protein GZH53_01055 [Flavihumibacter sp. R14]|nr:hypothetical protein [Flavihumibacter soli]